MNSSEHSLRPLLAPRSIALVGATERVGALGRFVLRNIERSGFHGTWYAINPKHRLICGKTCYPDFAALPGPVDLAVIVTPAHTVPGIIQDAGRAGVKAAVVLSAGFNKKGADGRTYGEATLDAGRRHGIRILGPNCVGVTRGDLSLNATFARAQAKPGTLALVSQSGAICTAVLDIAATEELGFSSVVSLGSALDVDFDDLLEFLQEDSATKSILLYIEGVHDAPGFLQALRAAAAVKPVIVMKSGRYAAGSQAASSHTGALMGRDEVFDAALRRCGAVRVTTYTQLIAAARTLASARPPAGDRIGILTNGGGLAVIAADSVMENEATLGTLSAATIEALDRVLPSNWSRANPVDIVGDADATRFRAAVDIALRDEGLDALLVLYCPTLPAEPLACAQAVAEAAAQSGKPVLAVWLDRTQAQACADAFEAHGVPHFESPEDAVEAFSFLAAYRRAQAQLHDAPPPFSAQDPADERAVMIATAIHAQAKREGRTLLSEHESKTVLRAFGLPAPETIVATSKEEVLAAARRIGYPVVLKIHSRDLTHKSDVGGVRLDLRDGAMLATSYDEMLTQVRRLCPKARIEGVGVQKMLRFKHAREVLIGVASDPVFGRVLSFGTGGTAVEVLRDTAVALPPLDEPLAHELMRRTRIYRLLQAHRDMPAADLDTLARLLVRVSRVVEALPWLAEMDLNPVFAHPDGTVIADARILIRT